MLVLVGSLGRQYGPDRQPGRTYSSFTLSLSVSYSAEKILFFLTSSEFPERPRDLEMAVFRDL